MLEQVTQPQWVSIKAETRQKLREVLMIPKTGHCETVTNELGVSHIISDGTTNTDLQAITVQKLIDFVGSAAVNESVYDLFKRAIAKIETPVVFEKPPVVIVAEIKQEVVADSKVVGDTIKCSKCAFESKSKFAIRMHYGKKHKT